MINFVYSNSPERGVNDLAGTIADALSRRQRVVWLLSGGSNVPIAASAMSLMRRTLPHTYFKNLILMQADERYGDVGHKDSNWRALGEGDFDFEGLKTHPILSGLSLDKTKENYEKILKKEFAESRMIIGQLGAGADGHIAGILPLSRAALSEELVFAYDAPPYKRITLGFSALKELTDSFVFAFGKEKREAVTRLRTEDLSLEIQPAQILRQMKNVNFYSDQI